MFKTAIYYFSATGNSLAAARALAQRLNAPDPISIPGSLVNSDPYAAVGSANAVGFVFPVQRATIPEMLRGFIQNMPVNPDCYHFAVATYSLFGSNEFCDIDELLSTKGAVLNHAASIKMMGNVGVSEPSTSTINHRLELMESKIDEIAEAVANRQENYIPRSNKLLGSVVQMYTKRRRQRIVFRVGKQCKFCGICAMVCPAQNIVVPKKGEAAAPIRSDKCQACLACIHWCPAGAIGTPTHLHTRYHNPQVSPEQLNQQKF